MHSFSSYQENIIFIIVIHVEKIIYMGILKRIGLRNNPVCHPVYEVISSLFLIFIAHSVCLHISLFDFYHSCLVSNSTVGFYYSREHTFLKKCRFLIIIWVIFIPRDLGISDLCRQRLTNFCN